VAELPSVGLPQHVADEKKLGELVEKADGFAEVFPEHKYEIVNILQKRNHMVCTQGCYAATSVSARPFPGCGLDCY